MDLGRISTTGQQRSGLHSSSPCLQPRKRVTSRGRMSTNVRASGGPNLLQRIGRLVREKGQSDFDRVFKGTAKTRERLSVVDELLGIWSLDDYEATLEELEEALIAADFGPKTALKVVDRIRDGIKAGRVKTADDTRVALKDAILELLRKGNEKQGAGSSELKLSSSKPAVILVVGVNGSGKTTTIGKLAHKLSNEGAKVYLVPGDTFRAAAAEQLAEWAKRANVTVGAFQDRAKPQKVIAQGCETALKDGSYDVVICDTAGRLHTAYALMEELEACKKAIGTGTGDQSQPNEVLLVLDGTTGLNMLNQAREFNESVAVTGLILTKLDGSARGGAVVSVVDQLGIPVKFVGVGEALEDLQPFNEDTFADALFPKS
ncbi:chloroplast SRP receptor [Dunaliella salina]|uniref:Chloroplast SRP receptor n=1 Tax=Dunaliella salina TaxID=3046 RepID=A0ABQ7GQ38_DUNSA|nr:chloroplast SRP receptor [Dunaliella salina]|eukprot:KAF5836728.1 chloroplast SRP receptor [Dunaliella salina]